MNEVYELLSHELKVEVSKHITQELLDGVPMFSNCSTNFLDSLSVLLRESRFSPHQYIFKTNEVAREMYFIFSGSVDRLIEIQGAPTVVDGHSRAGNCLGELSFFFQMRHLYSARTTTEVVVYVLAHPQFQSVLHLYPEDEETVASNALVKFDRARSVASIRSGAGSARSDEFDAVVGGGMCPFV